MAKTENYILVGQYFSTEEAESIRERFQESQIDFFINAHGPNFELDSKYYEIKVKSDDIVKAREIVEVEKRAFLSVKTKCPKCGHSAYDRIEKKSMLEKLIYAGTELVRCQVCGSKYGI